MSTIRTSRRSIPRTCVSGLPVLGLCYGHQLVCQELGGEVARGKIREYGSAELRIRSSTGLFAGMEPSQVVWMSHGDAASRLPEGFEVLGSTDDCATAAVGDVRRNLYGLQFHPEVAHTARGMDILDNFLDICAAPRTWTMAGYAETAMGEIREQVGRKRVFLLVSGGVDSSVAFALFNRALGPERVLGLHINNGFMRKEESARVACALRDEGFENLIVEDASEDFLLSVEGYGGAGTETAGRWPGLSQRQGSRARPDGPGFGWLAAGAGNALSGYDRVRRYGTFSGDQDAPQPGGRGGGTDCPRTGH